MPRARKAPADVDVRTALLDAAGALLSAHGPGALTTRRRAVDAGTTTQSIYTLFGGKEGVVRAMYREGYARLAARMRRVAETDDPLQDLRDLGRAYRAAALASAHYYSVMFGHPVPEFVPNGEDRDAARVAQGILAHGVQRCLDAGVLRADTDVAAVATWLWAAAHGLVSLELAGMYDLGPKRGVSPVYDEYLRYMLLPFLA
jgi:AcrR family transcriptional regulator